MDAGGEERITVVAGATTYGVTLNLGDTLVTVRTPRSAAEIGLTDEQTRAASLRNARRALEVALEEIGLVRG